MLNSPWQFHPPEIPLSMSPNRHHSEETAEVHDRAREKMDTPVSTSQRFPTIVDPGNSTSQRLESKEYFIASFVQQLDQQGSSIESSLDKRRMGKQGWEAAMGHREALA